jgi:hypothetical protein
MKKLNSNALLAILLTVLLTSAVFSQGQFKVRNDALIQIGYSGYKALTFGQGTSNPNNGNFALEYCSACPSSGFNIWKPWPTSLYGNYLLYIRDNGNIGMGNIGDNTAKLWISGNLRVNSTTYTSDARFKENVKPLYGQLTTLMQLKTYQYTFKQNDPKRGDSLSVNVNKEYLPSYNFDSNLHFGLIAQDIQKFYPNLVTRDENGYLSLNYTEFVPILIASLQEQNEQLKKQGQQIEAQNERIKQLELAISRLIQKQ